MGDGKTPLHKACYIGDVKVVEMLLKHGADPKATSDVSTVHPASPMPSGCCSCSMLSVFAPSLSPLHRAHPCVSILPLALCILSAIPLLSPFCVRALLVPP